MPGRMTDPGRYAALFDDLPLGLADLVKVVQNSLIHVFWAERYGVNLPESSKDTLQTRSLENKLARWTGGPLPAPRSPDQRQVGNCRDFSLLLTAILRHRGVPARARCGFGAYFQPDHFEDHWMVEVWEPRLRRWRQVDAQLDELQQKALGIQFDPLDMPAGAFVLAGKAWQRVRSGAADPERFGIFDLHGMEFIRGNIVRDLLSLNKVEILPWDWYIGYLDEESIAPEKIEATYEHFDRVAALTLAGDAAFDQVRELYLSDPHWQIPAEWG
jgi:transglutaminase-like putative cysteine protease